MGGDEDGDLVAAGQVDQVLPEAVPGHRVHARGRLVEDQQVGPVDQRHGELQALPLSQRERVGQRLHDLIEAEPRGRLFDALRDLVLGHVKELGVQDQVLPHRQLGIEREGLRHVADLAADGDVVGIDRLAEQPGLPLGGRQQAAQHLHRRRFAAAVGAEEAVDLPPLDPEVDVIDRGETAEPLGQAVRLDDHLVLARRARRDHHLLVAAALLLRQEGDEGRVQVPGPGARQQLRRRAGGEHVAGVHRHQPVEAGGLLHVGGRHQDAHARPVGPDAIDQLPELAARQRIDAGGRLVEDQQVRVVDQAQHRQSFCFMPPDSLPAGRSGKGPSPILSSSSAMRRLRSARPWPNSRAKKSVFSKTDSVG